MQIQLEENILVKSLNIENETQEIRYQKTLDFDDFLPESRNVITDYTCFLCKGVYYDPVCVAKCGHVFCSPCILAYLQFDKHCPLEKEKIHNCSNNLVSTENEDKANSEQNQNEISPSDFVSVDIINSYLNKQSVFCKNKSCNWIGKLYELKSHLEDVCEKQILNCPHENCTEKYFREILYIHSESCEWRIVNCQYCSENLPVKLLESHYHQCQEYPLKCELDCECFILRKNMKEHIDQDCSNGIIECDYLSFGCNEKFRRRDREDHLISKVADHIELLSKNAQENREKFSIEMQRIKGNVMKNEAKFTAWYRFLPSNLSEELYTDFNKVIDLNKKIEENFKYALNGKQILYNDTIDELRSKIIYLEQVRIEDMENKAKIENENLAMKEKIEELFSRINKIEEDKKSISTQKPNLNLSLLEGNYFFNFTFYLI